VYDTGLTRARARALTRDGPSKRAQIYHRRYFHYLPPVTAGPSRESPASPRGDLSPSPLPSLRSSPGKSPAESRGQREARRRLVSVRYACRGRELIFRMPPRGVRGEGGSSGAIRARSRHAIPPWPLRKFQFIRVLGRENQLSSRVSSRVSGRERKSRSSAWQVALSRSLSLRTDH